MKRTLLPQLIFLLALCALSSAQTPETSQGVCPIVSVQTPGGIALSGEPVWYKAIVSGDVREGLKYQWSVSKGKIISGQGTDSINTVYWGYPEVKTTVTVSGLPEGCANTASEIYGFIIDPGPIKLGEIAGPGYLIRKKLLYKIGKEARNNPNAQLYLILRFRAGTTDYFMRRTRTRIADQLKRTNIDGARMTFEMVSVGRNNATVFLVPPGANNPAP